MSCEAHQNHIHQHSEFCGHTRIQHGDHVDFLHDGHLHATHGTHFDECVIAVNANNPAECAQAECSCEHEGCGHEKVPHGDHHDYLVNGRLHHLHVNHCDDHGAVTM